MHIAVLDSVIAQNYLLKGFTKENSEYAIDESHGIPEIEITNPSTALKDINDLLHLDKLFNVVAQIVGSPLVSLPYRRAGSFAPIRCYRYVCRHPPG